MVISFQSFFCWYLFNLCSKSIFVRNRSISKFFLLIFAEICWSIACLHPSCRVLTWIWICANLNHRKKVKAERSRLIPRKHIETLVLLSGAVVWWQGTISVQYRRYKVSFNVSYLRIWLVSPWAHLGGTEIAKSFVRTVLQCSPKIWHWQPDCSLRRHDLTFWLVRIFFGDVADMFYLLQSKCCSTSLVTTRSTPTLRGIPSTPTLQGVPPTPTLQGVTWLESHLGPAWNLTLLLEVCWVFEVVSRFKKEIRCSTEFYPSCSLYIPGNVDLFTVSGNFHNVQILYERKVCISLRVCRWI